MPDENAEAIASSPDGRWVAYMSNESGRTEIYVRAFTAGAASDGTQWQVSTAGGIHPVWHPNGKELYYIDPVGAMVAVPIAANGTTIQSGTPLVLFATRIPLNPMSVVLGALVIAISTEFSVLLSERFRAERAAGHEPGEALQRTYRSTGAAVLASGTTAIAGFAVLVVSDIKMLRDFGFVTVVDLTVALLGVMVVLPAVLLLAEQGRLRLALPRTRLRAQRASTG